MMNVALFGSIILYLSLMFLPLRWITVIVSGLALLKNSEFFNSLGLSILKRVKKIDAKRKLQVAKVKFEAFKANFSDTVQNIIQYGIAIYEWPLTPIFFGLMTCAGYTLRLLKFVCSKAAKVRNTA